MKTKTCPHQTIFSARRFQNGFSLIELLIALAISLAVMASASAVFVASSRSSNISQYETRLNEDGALALNLIQQQIRQAGYSQSVVAGSEVVTNGNFSGIAVFGCDGGFTAASAEGLFDNLACNNDSTKPDSLVIRYQATADNTMPVKDPDGKDSPSNCIGNRIPLTTKSQASPAPSPAPADYALADNRYTIKTTGVPSLHCQGNEINLGTANGTARSQPLVANVEDMQITYGIARKPSLELAGEYDPQLHQIVAYASATEVNALSTSKTDDLEKTQDRWSRVVSVRVCLLMRSEQPVKDAPTGAFTYKNCNNVDTTPKPIDGYLRRTYTTTIALRNRLIDPALARNKDKGV